MTKKKRGHPDIEEVLARPWCYYCERDFDDDKVLMNHQKAKHFKCDKCGRRLNTAGGLSVHMSQVHKETLTTIENALPNRADLNVEIFGMEGIPEDVLQQHRQRVITQFHQEQADRRQATGNPPAGSAAGSAPKKPKLESPSDLKRRLAEHKAKKAAEAAGGGAAGSESGNSTPLTGPMGTQSPAPAQSPDPHTQAGAAQYTPSSFPHPFSQQNFGVPGQSSGFPPHIPPPTFAALPHPTPGAPHFPSQLSPFPPSGVAGFPPPPLQQPYGIPSPSPVSFQSNRPPPAHSTPPPSNPLINRPSSLPPAPGLPSRPSFGAPAVNALQMQQMHQGHMPPVHTNYHQQVQNLVTSAPEPSLHGVQEIKPIKADGLPAETPHPQETPAATSIQAEIAPSAPADTPATTQDQATPGAADAADKKAKKARDKDRPTKLVYSDNETSPEEKMAKMSRYAFDPASKKEEIYLGGAVEATTTGVVVGPDDVIDRQN